MATKSATAKKANLNKSVERIQKTAISVNKEVLKTANVVVDDVLANTKQLRSLATKTAKEAGKKIEFKNSIEKIRKTSDSVNRQIVKTAEEVLNDVKVTGKEAVTMATQNAKATIESIDVAEGVSNLTKAAKKANKVALETADEAMDSFFVNSEKWQKVAAKAVKGGLHLAGRQQKIVFDTLDTVKGQLMESTVRFRKLFG